MNKQIKLLGKIMQAPSSNYTRSDYFTAHSKPNHPKRTLLEQYKFISDFRILFFKYHTFSKITRDGTTIDEQLHVREKTVLQMVVQQVLRVHQKGLVDADGEMLGLQTLQSPDVYTAGT